MPKLPLYTVDAFTKVPFAGNPAAICLVGDRSLSEDTMQGLAAEMNISETAYVQLLEPSGDYKTAKRFGLRWFTPTNEVPLWGHATLASAAVLFFECGNENDEVVFSTLSGDLKAMRRKESITLDFPKNSPEELTTWEKFGGVINAVLGERPENLVKKVALAKHARKLVIQLDDKCTRSDLMAIAPNFEKMVVSHDGSVAAGVIVTVKGDGKYDFLSRYFSPWNGIPEDPVTGSAHTVLAPFWANALGKARMIAQQCSRRSGDVEVFVREDSRMDITGFAAVVITGNVNVP